MKKNPPKRKRVVPRSKSARNTKISEKQRALRDDIWSEIEEDRLWGGAETNGWTLFPKAFPIVMRIMDDLSNTKPISKTFLDLWCRVFDWDLSFVKLAGKHDEMAFCCGFDGQRSVQSWKARLNILAELGFIDIKPSGSSEIGYVLIYDPLKVIREIRQKDPNAFSERLWIAFTERLNELGDID